MFETKSSAAVVAQAVSAAVVAVAFLALIGIIFWRATEPNQDFAGIWGSAAGLLGVAIGIIPTYFFQRQVRAERGRSAALGDQRAVLAADAGPDAAREVIKP
jgi:hypothetical protein